MPKYTDEQVERAKNIDVKSFLEQTEGYTFVGHGRYLECRDKKNQPSSLKIDTESNLIFYNAKTGKNPLSAVDWCTKIKEMDFPTAMRLVLGENPQGERVEKPKFKQHTVSEKAASYEPKNLDLSERLDTTKHVYAYLTITRGIPENIVNDCINNNLIYEDVRKNAVFVGYDSDNKTPKYAARRGTYTPDGEEAFKRDCTGSDKSFAFRLEGKNTETVYVAEAAIDALSLAALEDKFHGKGAYKEKTYLSTGGAKIDKALEQFCKTHDVKTINVCFDDDPAGETGAKEIMQKFRERGYTVNEMRASHAHDYNDELVAFNNDPNFYSKPPDVVVGFSQTTTERSDTMPEQTMSENSKNEYIENALDDIVSHYDCIYTKKDLEKLPDSDKIHIADMYSKRPFNENDTNTYELDNRLNGDIFEAVNINSFKEIINADKLKQQGIEIEEIKTKANIRDDFYYEPSMTAEDLEFAFDETISSIYFKNEDRETVAFSSYYDLKNALSDPDSVLMRSAGQIESDSFIPFDDYSIPDEHYISKSVMQDEDRNIPVNQPVRPQTVQQEDKPTETPKTEPDVSKTPIQNEDRNVPDNQSPKPQTVQQEVKPTATPKAEPDVYKTPTQNEDRNVPDNKPNRPQTVQQEVRPTANNTEKAAAHSQPHEKSDRKVQPDKQALFSLEQHGEVYYYSTEKTANELLHISANSERPFAEMMNQGERISEDRYAEIMQSDKLKFTVDFNFDSKTANIFAVNNGRGGIAEGDRNPQNTSYKKANLSIFVKREAHLNASEQQKNTVSKKPAEPEIKSAVPTPSQAERKVQSEISPAVQPQPKMQTGNELSYTESTEKTNALLASLKDRQEKKRAVLLDKADIIDGKLADRKERINNLNKKISDIETSIKTAEAFKRVFGKTAIGGLIDKSIEKKQAKIKKIREVKIPKQEAKIGKLTEKQTKVTNKLEKTNKKIQRIDKVQGFIYAVSSKDKETRHKGFVTGLSELSDIRREKLENKLSKIQTKVDMLSARISSPELSNIDRLKIMSEIRNLNGKSSDISAKIDSMHNLRNDLEDMKNGRYSEKDIEAAVNRTAENISAKFDSSDIPENKGIVNHIISQTVESGNEAVSEITAQVSAERTEKAKPDLDRDRFPEEREPEVTVSTEQQILTSVAAITGVSIAELNRLPVELKADIIDQYRENNGNIPAEKLAEVICETIDIKPPVQEQKIPEKNTDERESKATDTRRTFEENIRSSTPIDDKKEKLTDKELNKPLFSRSAIMSDKYKPTSSKSAEDMEKDRQNRNKGAEL